MASLNRVLLIGNLTRDPELRYIPSGAAVTTFTLAVNRVYKSQTGEKEEVSFIRVVVWGKMGENCAQYLKKGSPAFVEGRLQTRSWDAPDGQKRSMTEVNAMNVQFLSRGTGSRTQEEYAEAPTPSSPQAGGGQGPLEEISLDMPSDPPASGGEVAPF